MKKIFLFFAAVVMTAGALSAQDINQATESYNNGAMELQMGNNEAAIENFQAALTMGEALGDEGADLVANCKKAIASATLSMAKDLYNAKDFDGAIAAFQEAQKVADEYGEPDLAAEAADLIGQTEMLKLNTEGKAAMKAKDYPTALACFAKVLEMDPTPEFVRLVESFLSSVLICSRSTTESFASPTRSAWMSICVGRRFLPILEVMAAAITVGENLLPTSF